MFKLRFSLVLGLWSCLIVSTQAATYGGGSGTQEDPYQIRTAEQMNAVGANPSDWGQYFKLMTNIDMSIYSGTQYHVIGNYMTRFSGTFDGNGHIISNLTYATTALTDYVGMFGYTSGAKIQNLGVTHASLSSGGDYIGGLVGFSTNTSITSCYVTGAVSGDYYVGGLVGHNESALTSCYAEGTINGLSAIGGLVGENYGVLTDCYATCQVTGNVNSNFASWVGGLVGRNYNRLFFCYATGSVVGPGRGTGGLVGRNDGIDAILAVCYATGSVTGGRDNTGGLVGENDSALIVACYAMGSVSGTSFAVGGLTGYNGGTACSCYATGSVYGRGSAGGLVGENSGAVTSCYAAGPVTGTEAVGGLVGYNWSGGLKNCFWDTVTSGKPYGIGYNKSSPGLTGKTTAEMQLLSTFTGAGWDFVDESANGLHDYWQMPVNDYPRLAFYPWTLEGDGTSANPYLVANPADLGKVWLRPSACYRLNGNLDLAGISWSSAVVPLFDGNFNGQGYCISNFTINHPELDRVGLFGRIKTGGQIWDLGVDKVSITGRNYVGGLVGYNDYGSMTLCYAGGSVRGNDYAGGLVGRNYGTLTSCHSTGSVCGNDYAGGLAGRSYGKLTFCYSTDSVSGNNYVGGLVGYNDYSLTSCYSAGSVSGKDCVGGLVGWNFNKLTTCYSTDSVSGNSYVGGLVGCNDSVITSCYSAGSVTGMDYVGGLAGYNGNKITTCFWDINTSGQSTSAGGTGKTTAEMKTLSTFTNAGWAIIVINYNPVDWKMLRPGEDYPRLKWQTVFPGDIAGLYGVDIADFAELAEHWLNLNCPADCEEADIDLSGSVDMADLILLSRDWMP